ncbi:MAG: 3'-5' exonuclease, partial [Dehalococcoidia bacterium]|nr:3'-5' exonuclease [Dehalococcoidia bacterium]
VEALNDLLASVMGRGVDDRSPNNVAFSPLEARRLQPRPGLEEPYVEVLYGVGEDSDMGRQVAARMLARRLLDLHERQGVKWEEVALLFRAAAGFPPYEAALEEAGIPFVTVAGRGFYDRSEVRDLLNILGALADPWDDLAMAGLLRSPAFGLSDAALYQFRWPDRTDGKVGLSFRLALKEDLSHLSESDRQKAGRALTIIDDLASLVDRVTVAELIKELIDKTLYRAILGAAGSGLRLQRNIDKLLADASASGLVRVADFLEYVATLREGGAREGEAPAEAGGAVRLMSVHRAKGLEFPVVVIADAARTRPSNYGPALFSNEFGLVPSPSGFDGKPLAYGLAKAIDEAQSNYEDLRVLYVAATRAREKLLICGHKSGRQSGSWLTLLAEAAGLNLEMIAGEPGVPRVSVLPRSGQKIAVLAESTVPEIGVNREPVVTVETEPPEKPLASLLDPLVKGRGDESAAGTGTPEFQIRRITRRRYVEGSIVGRLVHEAIRRWCFPGNPALARLLHTAAFTAGLIDADDIADHVRQASSLLARLQKEPRWMDLGRAKRWHEAPYYVIGNEEPTLGRIDLLYSIGEPDAQRWGVIDFKTDRINGEAEFEGLKNKYAKQVRRYRQAVVAILKGPVETTLCFLDCFGTIRWEDVD